MDGKREPGNALIGALVDSTTELAGAASLLGMLEEKAEAGDAVTSEELAAVRRIVKSCADALEAAWTGK